MKHTKGKWHQRKLFETPIEVIDEDRKWLSNSISIHGDDKRVICDVHFMTNTENQGYGNNDTLELFEANADVITKVPEMIEALKESKLQIEYLHEKFSETGSGNAMINKIESLIKEMKT